jgi:hypothetical protein
VTKPQKLRPVSMRRMASPFTRSAPSGERLNHIGSTIRCSYRPAPNAVPRSMTNSHSAVSASPPVHRRMLRRGAHRCSQKVAAYRSSGTYPGDSRRVTPLRCRRDRENIRPTMVEHAGIGVAHLARPPGFCDIALADAFHGAAMSAGAIDNDERGARDRATGYPAGLRGLRARPRRQQHETHAARALNP